MKKTIFKIVTITTGIFFSLTAFAQQQEANNTKVPQVSGPVLQTTTENKAQVSPPVATDKDLHETATKQSSFNGPVPVKATNETQAERAPERPQQYAETNKLTPPDTKKNR